VGTGNEEVSDGGLDIRFRKQLLDSQNVDVKGAPMNKNRLIKTM
jgi:hypothetical protein